MYIYNVMWYLSRDRGAFQSAFFVYKTVESPANA